MRLSASTNLFTVRRNGQLIPKIESIIRCYKAGYRVIDINFCDYKGNFDFLSQDNWMEYIKRMKELKYELNIDYSQSHIPFYNVASPDFSNNELYEEMVKRSIIASGELGVKWAVMHPGTAEDVNCSSEVSKKRNIEYFLPHIELAVKNNVGIAIENMADFPGSKTIRRYAATPEELCDLVDYFNDKNVGICWDFGHANLMRYDQTICLRYVGKRLKALHVADNRGKDDDHLLPFYGDIKWEKIMKTLVEIEYEGDFTYEVHGQVERMPDELTDEVAVHSINIGNYLLKLCLN